MEAKIIFNDKELIVEKNGDCYIVATDPELPEEFESVVIESENGIREYHDARLIECASIDGRYWFTFMEISQEEKEKAGLLKQIADLEETNAMLQNCILEMSEIVYA